MQHNSHMLTQGLGLYFKQCQKLSQIIEATSFRSQLCSFTLHSLVVLVVGSLQSFLAKREGERELLGLGPPRKKNRRASLAEALLLFPPPSCRSGLRRGHRPAEKASVGHAAAHTGRSVVTSFHPQSLLPLLTYALSHSASERNLYTTPK